MTIDLWMLLASAALQWLLILTAATPRLFGNGIMWSMSSRHAESKAMPPWAERAQRASDNLAENLPLFAIVVLVAHVVTGGTATSALGAKIFFGARVAHATLYISGVPALRTAVWAVSLVGLFLVASVLFQA